MAMNPINIIEQRIRNFAGALLQLEWLHVSLIISGFPCLFCHLGGQRYGAFYYNNHCHNCDLISNQVC